MNIVRIYRQFPTQETCIAHLEKARWGNVPVCSYCGSGNTYPLRVELRHHCNACRKSFSVTVGTIFFDTRLPMQKWFLAISLILNAKKGISARQLARDIEVNKDTAWSMAIRIRKAMQDDGKLLSGIVEMDETYVGGKPRGGNDHDDDDKKGGGFTSKRGRGSDKPVIVGAVERGGKVKARMISKFELTARELENLIRSGLDLAKSTLMTDQYSGYKGMKRLLPHETINHSKAYVKGHIHTNSIESFWALLKRGIVGQYHKVSRKWLDMYVAEFCYRYNARKENPALVFQSTLGRMLGC